MIVRDIYSHVIGQIEDGTFKKRIWGFKHILREPEPSIAIDAIAFDSVISRHAHMMVVLDKDTKDTLSVLTEDFTKQKQELDRGHGKQYFLPLRLWNVLKSPILAQLENGDLLVVEVKQGIISAWACIQMLRYCGAIIEQLIFRALPPGQFQFIPLDGLTPEV